MNLIRSTPLLNVERERDSRETPKVFYQLLILNTLLVFNVERERERERKKKSILSKHTPYP
jgi:hypothetical protein